MGLLYLYRICITIITGDGNVQSQSMINILSLADNFARLMVWLWHIQSLKQRKESVQFYGTSTFLSALRTS